jgi:hypothetical protein
MLVFAGFMLDFAVLYSLKYRSLPAAWDAGRQPLKLLAFQRVFLGR